MIFGALNDTTKLALTDFIDFLGRHAPGWSRLFYPLTVGTQRTWAFPTVVAMTHG